MNPHRLILPAAALGLAALALAACAAPAQPQPVAGAAAPVASAPASAAVPNTASATNQTRAPSVPTSYTHFDRAGLLALVPNGWTKDQRAADHTDFRDPTGQLLLRLGYVDFDKYLYTKPDAYLRQLAAQTSKNYPQYKLISISGTARRPGVTEGDVGDYFRAEWQFTFVKDGVTRHVLLAGVSDGDGTDTFGQVYYSAPERYFAATSTVYQHAMQELIYAD